MDRPKIEYCELDETRRRDDHVSAAFDILFEQVVRDWQSLRLEESHQTSIIPIWNPS